MASDEFVPQMPGTVSNVLWHFTGGPKWDAATGKQGTSRKSATKAYEALVGILEAKELRIGAYKEVVKVRVEKVRTWDKKAKKYRIDHDVMQTLESAPVGCLTDIPIRHLAYHATRYGQFAIGFHRAAALQAGFNPVFYTLHDSTVMREIHEGFAKAEATSLDFSEMLLGELATITAEAELHDEVDGFLEALRSDAKDIGVALSMAKSSIAAFLAFVKTLESDELRSIYCEREWRSVKPFKFQLTDVAMIVMPLRTEAQDYFVPFVSGRAKALGLPNTIPVVPWETLVES
jgi:hypothetical protein